MGLFGNKRVVRNLAPGRADVLIERHVSGAFSASDRLSLPAGWEAILVRGGDFSDTLLEGNDCLPIKDRREVEGALYFVRTKPEDALEWGCGGVKAGEYTCGMHGTLRVEVVSTQKLLKALISENMPLTLEHAFDLLEADVLDAVRSAAQQVARESGAIEGIEARIAETARAALENPLERYGLAATELAVEGVFVSPGEG